MSSVLSEIKQVPVTGGKFVCIVDANALHTVSSTASDSGRVPTATTIGGGVGNEYIDLGITYVDKTSKIVYRKVVKVADAVSSASPTAYFIQTFNPTTGTVKFARTA